VNYLGGKSTSESKQVTNVNSYQYETKKSDCPY